VGVDTVVPVVVFLVVGTGRSLVSEDVEEDGVDGFEVEL
jgi:hypothetical protein